MTLDRSGCTCNYGVGKKLCLFMSGLLVTLLLLQDAGILYNTVTTQYANFARNRSRDDSMQIERDSTVLRRQTAIIPDTVLLTEDVVETRNNASAIGGSDVLIVGYMRTGSSFMGKVLGYRDDVFYWMEPLRKDKNWMYYRDRDLLCDYLTPVCKLIPEKSVLSSSKSLTLLDDIFNCDLRDHADIPTDINTAEFTKAPSWIPYADCRDSSNKECIGVLEKSCRNARHRVVKVVRIDLERASNLLKVNPRLKIVMIFRDPRGSFNSHLKTWWYRDMLMTEEKKEDNVQVLCSRLLNDIITGKTLTKLYPDRVKLVQYEDISDVRRQMNKMYRYFGFEVSEKYDKFIDSVFENPAEGGVGGFHPFSYRQSLSWSNVKIVHKYCNVVLKELGLREFKTEADYNDTSVSAVKDKLPFSFD